MVGAEGVGLSERCRRQRRESGRDNSSRAATRRAVGVDRGRWCRRWRRGQVRTSRQGRRGEGDGNVNSSRGRQDWWSFVARGPRARTRSRSWSEGRGSQSQRQRRRERLAMVSDGRRQRQIPKFPRPTKMMGEEEDKREQHGSADRKRGSSDGQRTLDNHRSARGSQADAKHARNLLAGPDRKGLCPALGQVTGGPGGPGGPSWWWRRALGQKKCLIIFGSGISTWSALLMNTRQMPRMIIPGD